MMMIFMKRKFQKKSYYDIEYIILPGSCGMIESLDLNCSRVTFAVSTLSMRMFPSISAILNNDPINDDLPA